MESANKHEYDTELKEIAEKLNNKDYEKIIVSGGKKSGKTESLKYYAKNYNDQFNSVLYLDYKDFNYKASLSDKEYTVYCELVMVKKMLDSIKMYNPKLFSNFKFYNNYITRELNKFREYLLTRFCVRDDIYFEKGSLVKNMLNIFNISDIKNINLVIDHFDFVGESSQRFQKFMSEYADYFDKFIVTTNENMDSEKKDRLKDNGFYIINVQNGKNIDVVKKILNSYLNELEQNGFYDVNYIVRLHNLYKLMRDDDFYTMLIEKCNGNIEVMLSVLRCYIVDNDLEKSINSSVRLQNELDSITYKRILHL